MKVKTSELSGVQLDVAVALALEMTGGDLRVRGGYGCSYYNGSGLKTFSPSTDWSQCGNLIEAEGIEFKWVSDATLEAHSYLHDPHYGYGLTHQEAACRLIVASKLGDEVDIPDELMEVGE